MARVGTDDGLRSRNQASTQPAALSMASGEPQSRRQRQRAAVGGEQFVGGDYVFGDFSREAETAAATMARIRAAAGAGAGTAAGASTMLAAGRPPDALMFGNQHAGPRGVLSPSSFVTSGTTAERNDAQGTLLGAATIGGAPNVGYRGVQAQLGLGHSSLGNGYSRPRSGPAAAPPQYNPAGHVRTIVAGAANALGFAGFGSGSSSSPFSPLDAMLSSAVANRLPVAGDGGSLPPSYGTIRLPFPVGGGSLPPSYGTVHLDDPPRSAPNGEQAGERNPDARRMPHQFRSKAVCRLDCRGCGSLVCMRGMKAMLLADTRVELYSTDTPPFSVQLIGEDYTTRNCRCKIRDVACLGCGEVCGYHITAPCARCMDSCNNGHFWMFHTDAVAPYERTDGSGIKTLLWATLPAAENDVDPLNANHVPCR